MHKPGMRLPVVPPGWRRLALIAGGLVVFFWLRLEDDGVATAVVMGLILTALIGLFQVWPRLTRCNWSARGLLLMATLAGAGAGASTTLAAAGLMVLKNGFHGHLNPDYPVSLLLATMERAPAWALAGALLGLGAALLALGRLRNGELGQPPL